MLQHALNAALGLQTHLLEETQLHHVQHVTQGLGQVLELLLVMFALKGLIIQLMVALLSALVLIAQQEVGLVVEPLHAFIAFLGLQVQQ